MRKPILMGVKNPYSCSPADALAPWPPNSSGFRLWKLTRLTMDEYEDKFDRRNLATHSHDPIADGSTVVLLGDEVRKHFGIPKLFLLPYVKNGVTYRQIPHPSGRTLFYNDPVLRDLVTMMLRELANGKGS